MRLRFKLFLATTEGLLLPDKPAVPGMSRINTSLFPRSRYRMNPGLRLRPPPSPTPPSPPRPPSPGLRL